VREWVKHAERDAGAGRDGGLTSSERKELAELRAENRRLREDVEILKRVTAFFELRRPGELLLVHQGGESAAPQCQAGVRAAGGLPCCLLRRPGRVTLRPRPRGRGADCAHHGRAQAVEGPVRRGADPRGAAPAAFRKRVARPMRQAGLAGRVPRRWKKTTIPDPAAAARADSIRRDFTADASKINQRWCGDITYIVTWEGWLYLATVIDIAPAAMKASTCSRRMLATVVGMPLRTRNAARSAPSSA
jgi:hypothetical protein